MDKLQTNDKLQAEDKLLELKTTNKLVKNANSHKEISQHLLNLSVIQTQIGLLVGVYYSGCESLGLCKTTIALVIISLALQGLIFILVTWLFYVGASYNGFISARMVNGIVTFLSGLSLVVNCCITTVSLKIPGINSTSFVNPNQ